MKKNFKPTDFKELLPTPDTNQCGIATVNRERLFKATKSVTLLTLSLNLNYGQIKSLLNNL